jgi:hypothetical protein
MNIRLDARGLAQALGGDAHGDKISAPGPGHSSTDRSLTVWIKPDAPDGFTVHSHAGDDPIGCRDYVRQKAGLPTFERKRKAAQWPFNIQAALMAAVAAQRQDAAEPPSKARIIATYEYRDANGELLYQVCRLEPKSFRQRRPDSKNGWIWSIGEEKRVPYRLGELLKFPDASVFFCEGEKDADRVAELGQCATAVASGKWTPDCVQALAGRDVFILEDNDDAGRRKAAEAATALHGTAKSIRIVRLPDLPDKGDVSDWLDADPGNAARFVDICIAAPLATPEETAEPAKPDDTPRTFIKSSADFIAGHVPPEYVVVGVLVRRFLYSFTGQTGAGKTCVTLRLAASTALGAMFAGRETKRCRVLYAAAENPEDVRMRWIALAQHMGFDPAEIQVYFTEGTFKISRAAAKLRAEAEALGGAFGLVIVDTGPAFFEGDDENSRQQMGAHARLMRDLIAVIPGGPAVIVNCHPVKNATADNLLPAGGGTFLNEVDGNLTCAKNDSLTELHWQGKFRGPEFAPMNFLIKTVTHQDIKDSDGRLLPTVICECLSDQAREEIAAAGRKDEDAILALIEADPKATLHKLAQAMGWKLHDGGPNRMKVKRCLDVLKRAKLIKETRAGRRILTKEGKKVLEGEDE